jgi:hypothetical protein
MKEKLNNWKIPSTLEEWQQSLNTRQESSSTSEAKKEEQQEATKVYEVRFVNNQKKNI